MTHGQNICAATLAGLECCANIAAGVIDASLISGGHRPDGQSDHDGQVAQLQCPFHRLIGQADGSAQMPTPRLQHAAVEGDVDQLTFLAALDTMPAHGQHLLGCPVELSGPGEQQTLLHARAHRQRHLPLELLEFHGAGEAGPVEAIATHEAKQLPNGECLAEQIAVAETFGVGDGVLCPARTLGHPADAEQRKGQVHQHRRAAGETVSGLADGAFEKVCAFGEAVHPEPHEAKQPESVRAHLGLARGLSTVSSSSLCARPGSPALK